MTALNQNDRLDCERILERKRLWGLESLKFKDNHFVKNADKHFVMKSLENSFITRFINRKFKNSPEDSGTPEKDSKTLIEHKIKPKIAVEPKIDERTGRVSELTKNFKKLFDVKK